MRIIIDKSVRVEMRDGVGLGTDVYRLDTTEPMPVLLQRLPYSKELPSVQNAFHLMRAVQAGYVVVVQDTRGRYTSEGSFTPFVDDGRDGADAVGWCAAQPWSNGRVGMIGGSYFGATQWRAASEAPPALMAFAPSVTVADYHEGWTYRGGAFELGFVHHWTLGLAGAEAGRRIAAGTASPEVLAELVRVRDDNDRLFWRLPLTDVPELRDVAPYYLDWLAHPDRDEYWRAIAPIERHHAITAPAFNIGGWHDIFLSGTLANWNGMRRHGATDRVRSMQRLTIGPWAHGSYLGMFAERLYGTAASMDGADITGRVLRYFDHLVKGHANGVDRDKPVRIFVMGPDEWRDEDDWPLPDTTFTPFYLHSAGRANTAAGDGTLSGDIPGSESEDVYLYDPRDPVPTVGGQTLLPGLAVAANAGPRDQRVVEARADVLCYTSAPLTQATEVTGPVELVLFASSSALDTDFTAKLVDVHPDGRAVLVTDGILRARYRRSTAEPELLEPGHIYEMRIDLVATATVFEAGHQIRLEVSSSNFPRFDRNTNTGGVIAGEGAECLVDAMNRVHHDSAHPSHLILPIIDRR